MIALPVIITQPAIEPISLEDARGHLRVDTDLDDALISNLIRMGRAWCEEYSGLSLITQTLELRLECFYASEIRLPRWPVQSITSINYIDVNGSDTLLASTEYKLSGAEAYPNVRPAYAKTWPSARNQPESVRIRYITGFGATADSIPPHYRHAILLMIGHYYANRGDVTAVDAPRAAMALVGPSRVRAI